MRSKTPCATLGPMRLWGRIQDAVRTLAGRTEAQMELARMRAQFADLMIDVTTALEKLNTMAARLAKRESRALAGAPPEADKPPDQLPVVSRSHPKAELHRRAAELRASRRHSA